MDRQRVCRSCRTLNRPEAWYCAQCGESLSARRRLEPRAFDTPSAVGNGRLVGLALVFALVVVAVLLIAETGPRSGFWLAPLFGVFVLAGRGRRRRFR